MANGSTEPASGISLPRETFAKLTPSAYLHAHLKQSIRPGGRNAEAFREPVINTGSLSYSNGSAVVRLGDTAVVCGMRGELLLASDIPDHPADSNDLINQLGLLVPNFELSTGCSPAYLPGNPPSTQAQSLSWRLHSLLRVSNLIDIDALRIQHLPPPSDDLDKPELVTKAYWTLYLDILCISLDGNCFDAACIAVLAALKDTKLPEARWDADQEMIVCSPLLDNASYLKLRSIPIPTTFMTYSIASPLKDPSATQSWTLIDPDAFEEETCKDSITITIDNGTIIRMEKVGPGPGKEEMKRIFALAKTRAKAIMQKL